MKTYRRIEITAFRRRLTIVSGEPMAATEDLAILVNDADSNETIETESDEGQKILLDAVRILEEKISQTESIEASAVEGDQTPTN